MQRFRGGLVVFKAHEPCVSFNSRLESNKEDEEEPNALRVGVDQRLVHLLGGGVTLLLRVPVHQIIGRACFDWEV